MSKYVLSELLSNGLELVYAAHHQGAAQVEADLDNSTYPDLRASLEMGAKTNRERAKRLEKIFKRLGLAANGTPDQVMQGIIDTNNSLIAQTSNPTERDLINIASGQHAAHFYLASYGALRHYAQELGHTKVAKLLQQTLDEIGETNKRLTAISMRLVDESSKRLAGTSDDGGLLRTTIPAFFAVGLVGLAITLASKNAAAPESAN